MEGWCKTLVCQLGWDKCCRLRDVLWRRVEQWKLWLRTLQQVVQGVGVHSGGWVVVKVARHNDRDATWVSPLCGSTAQHVAHSLVQLLQLCKLR